MNLDLDCQLFKINHTMDWQQQLYYLYEDLCLPNLLKQVHKREMVIRANRFMHQTAKVEKRINQFMPK